MLTWRYKRTLAIRFSAYMFIFIGFATILFQFGPVIIAEYNYRKDQVLGIKREVAPIIITSGGSAEATSGADLDNPSSGFGSVIASENIIKPLSTDYGIVIEKINANTKVIGDIDPANERQYTQALSQGVAAAIGSTEPGRQGNLFIFSHSADAPWNVARLNAVFYLLRELEPGDRVIVYYQGRRYDYLVFDKQVVAANDISFLANRYDKPVLTLQTCDPPGTLLNRLIVRAQLVGS